MQTGERFCKHRSGFKVMRFGVHERASARKMKKKEEGVEEEENDDEEESWMKNVE
jgi:hypothetical protein